MDPNEGKDSRHEPAETDLVRLESPARDRSEKPKVNWRLLLPIIGLVVAFALGFVPMWLKAQRHGTERDAAQRQVQILELEALIARATIDARRGEYEPARQTASEFFSSLAEEVNNSAEQSSLNPAQQTNLQPLLKERDDLITLLARSDPASAERLANIYLRFRKSLAHPSETPAPAAAKDR